MTTATPLYLQTPDQPDRTYGTLEYDDARDQWVLFVGIMGDEDDTDSERDLAQTVASEHVNYPRLKSGAWR